MNQTCAQFSQSGGLFWKKKLTTSSRFSLLILTISPQAGKINPKQNTTITKTQEHKFLQKQNFLLHKHIANRMTGWKNVNMKHLFSFNRKLQTAVIFPIIHSWFEIGIFYRIIFLFTLKLFLNIVTVSVCVCLSAESIWFVFYEMPFSISSVKWQEDDRWQCEEVRRRLIKKVNVFETDVDRLLGWSANWLK